MYEFALGFLLLPITLSFMIAYYKFFKLFIKDGIKIDILTLTLTYTSVGLVYWFLLSVVAMEW